MANGLTTTDFICICILLTFCTQCTVIKIDEASDKIVTAITHQNERM